MVDRPRSRSRSSALLCFFALLETRGPGGDAIVHILSLRRVNILASMLLVCHLVQPSPVQPSSLQRSRVIVASTASNNIEAVDGKSLPRVADFFVDSFWAAGTTSGQVELTTRERKGLAKRMRTDFDERYSSSWAKPRQTNPLFPARMLLASDDVRSPPSISGCVGIEAALLNPFTRQLLTRAQSEMLLRSELDAMDGDEYQQHASLSRAALVQALYPEWQCLALLTNLAVAPSRRRSGIARMLCAYCEDGCASRWHLPAVLLQVEETNGAAIALYRALGFEELWRESDVPSVRLDPGAGTLASALLMVENDETLLTTEPSTVITMAKSVSGGVSS